MSDHLHPARPEYLRRGTPVLHEAETLCLVEDPSIGAFVFVGRPTVGHAGLTHADELDLDLRDPTARAHAARAYLRVDTGGHVWPLAAIWNVWEQGIKPEDRPNASRFMKTLHRMLALDESVTAAEARAALLWAEGVVDAAAT